MTTISTQQVLDYILEEISKDFTINHDTLVEKYGSLETIYNTIQNKISKKKVVRRVSKATVQEPKVEQVYIPIETINETPVETPPKKKVIRKVSKNIVEQPKLDIVAVPLPETSVESPKKKVVRKITKIPEIVSVAPPTNPVTETVNLVVLEPQEEKVKPQPKRIVKKISTNVSALEKEVQEIPKKKSKKNLELLEFGAEEDNSLEGCDELEENVYVDTQIYNDEDSDSLELLEINTDKYYIDSSRYVYHIDTQELIGKLNEKGDNIIFLSDFSTEKHD